MLQGNQSVRFWLSAPHQGVFDGAFKSKGVFDKAFDAWLFAEDQFGYWVEPAKLGAEVKNAVAVHLKREFVLAVAILDWPAPAGHRSPIGFRV
ncbi:MAG TPA: hypothetical protein VMV31_02450 [Terriglobales bacterium]|nr:hypothetical protein [Terriglobales bacterium]